MTYRQLLEQALLLLRLPWQSIYAGSGNGFALLFELNTLFKYYLGRFVRMLQSQINCRASFQGPRNFALEEHAGSRHFVTKSDIHLERQSGGGRIILDTKWKHLKLSERSEPWGISNFDVYQMLASAEMHDAGRVILLIPQASELQRAPGTVDRFFTSHRKRQVYVAAVDLTKLASTPDQLNAVTAT